MNLQLDERHFTTHIYGMDAILIKPMQDTQPNKTPASNFEVLRAKADYILGLSTLETLSTTYNVSVDCLYRHSGAENWLQQRKDFAQKGDGRLNLANQITAIDELIDECTDPKDKYMLLKSKREAWEMFWRLTGHPKPPTAKARTANDPAKAAMLAKLGSGKRGKAAAKPAPVQTVYWSDYGDY